MANLQGGQQLISIRSGIRPIIHGSRTTRCVMFGLEGTLAIFGLFSDPLGWAGSVAFVADWYFNGSGC